MPPTLNLKVPPPPDEPLEARLQYRHLNTTQRAMLGARMANAESGPPPSRRPSGGAGIITIAEAAKLLNVSKDSITQARNILRAGTPEEVQALKDGTLPLIVGREISEGVPPEERARRRPGDKTSPLNRSAPPLTRRAYEMIEAEEGRRRRRNNRRKSTAPAESGQADAAAAEPDPDPENPEPPPPSPPAPLSLVEMIDSLIVASLDIPVEEAAAIIREHADESLMTGLVEWLIDLTDAVRKKVE